MDGVVIDSEGCWAVAEREVFTSLGVVMTEAHCQLTRMMTVAEASQFWFSQSPWANVTTQEAEQMVVDRVIELIRTQNCEIAHVREFIEYLKGTGYKIGLATNSPEFFIPVCLERAGIADLFDVVSSAEHEANGKPFPDVYLTTARKLDVRPEDCVVIEDSYHGLQAGKSAGMTVVGFTNGNSEIRFDIADYMLHSYKRL